MEYYLISFAGILFGTIATVKETRSVKKHSSLLLINVFGYMYAAAYGFLPACVLLGYVIGKIDLSHGYYIVDYTAEGLQQIFIWMLMGIFGYLVVQFSYRCRFYARGANRAIVVKKRHSSVDFIQHDTQKMYSILQTTMIICFIISVISLILWTWAYGGLFGLIKIGDKVRGGVSEVRNPIAFFARPAKMILIACYMALVLVKKRYNTVVNSIFFGVSFILSGLMHLALDGRFGAAIHILSIVLLAQGHLKLGAFSWKKLRKILIVGIILLIGILNMDAITFYIRNGYWKSTSSAPLFEELFSEFSYIIAGAQHSVGQLMDGNCPYLIGHDVAAGIFAWLPSSLRPDGIINIWNYNTELCTIGQWIYGQLPCDFITTSVYALGFFGPLVYGLFWGWVIKRMDCWYQKSTDPAAEIFYCTFLMRVLKLTNYCLLYDFILGLFSIVLAACIWWMCKRSNLNIRFKNCGD